MAFDAGLPSEPKPALDFSAFLKIEPPEQLEDYWRYRHVPPNLDLALLKIARDRMARGWTQRTLVDPYTGNVCAVGALLSAIQGQQHPHAATLDQDLIVERLARHIDGMSASQLMSLNDMRMTNKNYMLMLFDRAIRRLEEKVFGHSNNAQTSPIPYIDVARINYRPQWDMP